MSTQAVPNHPEAKESSDASSVVPELEQDYNCHRSGNSFEAVVEPGKDIDMVSRESSSEAVDNSEDVPMVSRVPSFSTKVESNDGDKMMISIASMPEKDGATSYHIDSDTVISLQDGSTRCRVSSCCLAAASPVWRDMLYGQNATNRPEHGEWVIDLQGDPKAVDTLFKIVHYEFHMVPQSLDINELYEISVVVARYKCAHLVHPYAKGWLQPFIDFATSPRGYLDAHLVACIAWTLGDHLLYAQMADNLALVASVDSEGHLVNAEGKRFADLNLPEGLLEIISDVRHMTILDILVALDVTTNMISEPRELALKYCKVIEDAENCPEGCSAMLAGSAIPVLIRAGLFPVPNSSVYSGSILDIKKALESITTVPYVGPNYKPHLSHNECTLGLKEMVHDCLAHMPDTVSEKQVAYLKKEAKLTGVYMDIDDPVDEETQNNSTSDPIANRRARFRVVV